MSVGQALGDALQVGYGVYDRDRQQREAHAADLERERLRDEVQRSLDALRAQHDVDLEDRRHTNQMGELSERDRLQQVDDARTLASFNDFLKPLPSNVQTRARAKQFGVALDDADLMTPEERAAAYDTETGRLASREFQVSAARTRGSAAGKPAKPAFALQTDDPALPRGVRQYLASLPGKHGYNRAAALDDVRTTWAQLVAAHPRVEPTRVLKELDALFGTSEMPYTAPEKQSTASASETGERTGSGRGAPPGSASSLTRAELRVLAAKRGVTEQQAEAEARQYGFAIVD